MNIEAVTELSFDALLNPSDPEESGADVILWMGTEKEPIYAHSNILRNASDYYKAAVSSRWNMKNEESPVAAKERDAKSTVDSDADSDTVVVNAAAASEDESAQPVASTESVPSPTFTKDPAKPVSTDLSKMYYEIHHPEFEKGHMIQVLHYMYRVPITVKTEDVLDVALIANHLLISGLEHRCLSYIVKSTTNVETCAFKLYLLAVTLFSKADSDLMRLALEIIDQSFDACIKAIPDVASMGKREVEALIVGLQLSAKQKWILLIVWAMASTGMLDDCSENPIQYVFKDLSWKENVNDSFKKAVIDLVHLIPFPDFSKSDYEEFVRPFKDLGVLEALNLKDFLICLFESKDQTVQDPQLLARVKHQTSSSIRAVSNMLKSFPKALSMTMIDFIAEKVLSSIGELSFPEDGMESDKVIRNGSNCLKNSRLQQCSRKSTICVHVFSTKQGSLAIVIFDKDQKMDYMIYRRQGVESTLTQKHKSEISCRYYDPSLSSQSPAYRSCECRECNTYVEKKGTRGHVRYPRGLKGEQMQDYDIYYFS